MAGIYIHIPYCKQACSYCDFYFSTNVRSQGTFVQALLREIELRKGFFGTKKRETREIPAFAGMTEKHLSDALVVQTIYFGGGTPSLLTADELSAILHALHAHYTISPDAEVTLEANPDDLTAERLHTLRAAGVNRLSIGIQSFHEADLRMMHRAHDAQMALACVGLAQQAGFENISVDLMFHLPGQSMAQWQENLTIAISLGVPHISVYGLTVEPKTLLAHQLATGKLIASNEAAFTTQFDLLMETMQQAGYVQYEISNFCKPGWHSRHNSSYWAGQPYLGLGPSAHSHDGIRTRMFNLPNLHTYSEALQQGKLPNTETEMLTDMQLFNEFLLTRLRLASGVVLAELEQLDQALFATWLEENKVVIQNYKNEGLLANTNTSLALTQRGRHVADAITTTLMISE